MDCFESCSVQIGDKAFLELSPSDRIETIVPTGKKSLMHFIMQKNNQLPRTNTSMCAKRPEDSAVNEPTQLTSDEKCIENGVGNNDKAVQTVQDDLIDSEEEDDDDDSDTCSTGSASSTQSTGSQSSMKKKKSALHARLMKKSKLKRMRKNKNMGVTACSFKAGDCLPVEIICTMSSIEVVWQVM